jgi:hypothetical protein
MRFQLWSPITQCRFVAWLQNPVQTANAAADGNELLKLTRSRKNGDRRLLRDDDADSSPASYRRKTEIPDNSRLANAGSQYAAQELGDVAFRS